MKQAYYEKLIKVNKLLNKVDNNVKQSSNALVYYLLRNFCNSENEFSEINSTINIVNSTQRLKELLTEELLRLFEYKKTASHYRYSNSRLNKQETICKQGLSLVRMFIRSYTSALRVEQKLYLENKKLISPEVYRYKARFNINKDLTKIKGYNLLVKYGFYNKNNNTTGCVLDHRVSIKYGIDNNIDPTILGHLANCEFLSYIDNLKKGSKCSISYKQLLLEINNWN